MTHDISYRRILHKMGYYNYQQGLIYHHLKEEGGWNSHLRNCRNFILKSLDFFKPSVVTVLGSGWLLDVPLKEMADKVSEINLVDIVHPPEVKEQIGRINKIRLIEEDITGGLIGEAWAKAGGNPLFKRLKSLDKMVIPDYRPSYDPGMVISLNIFTQLESLPLAYLKKKTRAGEGSLLGFRKEIQEKHISFLSQHDSVLITDLAEIITEKSGRTSDVQSVLADLPEGKYRETWSWQFDLKRSDYYTRRSVFSVLGMIL